jgi:hypothetical protein
MVSTLLKTIIIILFVSGLLYCANLAFQGNLEMEVILHDYHVAVEYLKGILK